MNYSGMKILVMGLGLHGGGLESALYLARRGGEITVTDLRDARTLSPSIERLDAATGGAVRYVLGRHETADFTHADIVIKNPGVPAHSPYLQAARRVETDISLFLAACPARLAAVTGSKGKSGTACALHWTLAKAREDAAFSRRAGTAYLGGNITVSPLSFLDRLCADDDVVLELSSWQLGDLKGRTRADGAPLLQPAAAVLTAIMPDHLDRYADMNAYVADKRLIYAGQDETDWTIAGDDAWGISFHAESRGRRVVYSRARPALGVSGGWIAAGGEGRACFYDNAPEGVTAGESFVLVPEQTLVPGLHQKTNLLAAGLAALALGVEPACAREALGSFAGIEHRLEFFHEAGGVRYYNDSAATIPEAAAAAVDALADGAPLVLVTGGTDKNLDFTPLAAAAPRAKAIILLAGTGSAKLAALLDSHGAAYAGPFDSVEKAVRAAADAAAAGDRVVLSPGCTSFGMFLNEFDRGRQWKSAVRDFA